MSSSQPERTLVRTVDEALLIVDGVIVGRGAEAERATAEDQVTEVVDATELAGPGARLAPGFVDIHCHGGGEASVDGSLTDVRRVLATHAAHGTTSLVLSLVSAPIDVLRAQVARIADWVGTEPGVAGSHLEGPFLDPGHKGAHDPGALRAPTPRDIDTLLEAGRGTIRQVTLAPELPGALDAVARFAEAGVRVAIGHTNADAATTRAAFDAGATLLTHAFNAMPPLLHRAIGPIGAALADPRVTLEVIADGVHVDPVLVRTLFAAAPGRVALITDAMAAAGSSDGDYTLGSLRVRVRDGVARLDDGAGTVGVIAGSTLTMDAAVRTAVRAGVAPADALAAASIVPARALGLAAGTLEVGAPAAVVLLDAEVAVRAVWRGGVRLT